MRRNVIESFVHGGSRLRSFFTAVLPQAVEKSPFLEKLEKKGLEVLYLVETVDEMTVGAVTEFEDKK